MVILDVGWIKSGLLGLTFRNVVQDVLLDVNVESYFGYDFNNGSSNNVSQIWVAKILPRFSVWGIKFFIVVLSSWRQYLLHRRNAVSPIIIVLSSPHKIQVLWIGLCQRWLMTQKHFKSNGCIWVEWVLNLEAENTCQGFIQIEKSFFNQLQNGYAWEAFGKWGNHEHCIGIDWVIVGIFGAHIVIEELFAISCDFQLNTP